MRTKGRVLVVDDDQQLLAGVSQALQEEGFAVVTAARAGTALDFLWAAWHDQPDVILLDMRMPTMDGQAFVETYHLLPVPHAPIILMTGIPNAGEVASRVNAQDVLVKPFEVHELLERIHRAPLPTAA